MVPSYSTVAEHQLNKTTDKSHKTTLVLEWREHRTSIHKKTKKSKNIYFTL